MSDNDDKCPIWLALVAMVAGMALASFVAYVGGRDIARQGARDEAVKAGHAEYYLDENNNRQWRWK